MLPIFIYSGIGFKYVLYIYSCLMSDVRKYLKKRVYKKGGTKKNVRFDSSVKPEDENAKIYHELPHSSILVRNDIQKFTDGRRNEKNMTKKYEDMYSDIIGSKKWMDSDNPKWDRVYKRINRVSENTSRNSKLGGQLRRTIKQKKNKRANKKRKAAKKHRITKKTNRNTNLIIYQ
jgi:hypothetical protein